MFNEDILIDRNALEEECTKAPAFFDYWQNRESDYKDQKENYEADFSKRLRQMSDDEIKVTHGISSKLTEGAISAIIKSNGEYQRLKSMHFQAESNRKSCEKKITMLDVLAKLHGQGYFAKIEGKKDTVSLLASHVKKQIQKQIEKQSRKPKRPTK